MGSSRDPRRLRGYRILIVEDEILLAMELESLLRGEGYQVVGPAPSVARALSLLEDSAVDAALLDLNLNGERAVGVAKALAARHVPFVIVSGYNRKEGGNGVLGDAPRLAKPVNERELKRVLAEVMDSLPSNGSSRAC
jgi:CheY-like chemotaxis protein